MRNIRKLYFQNSAGELYRLNGEKGVYASSLAGFGISLAPEFADLSRGFFAPVDLETEPQHPIPFILTFTKAPYQTYRAFVDWISRADGLMLVYSPFGEQEFCRKISVESIEKGELNRVGWLECSCRFLCLTPWYLPTPTALFLIGSGSDNSKRYPYVYTEDLMYGMDGTSALIGTLAHAGHIPGALELRYRGAISNPKIRLTGNISGLVYGICTVSTELAPADTLVFSSRYEESYVKKISAAGVETDLLDFLDLNTTPFFHIPVGEPCTISLEADSAIAGSAELLVYYYFRSV